jgi:hypothetical protein
MRILLALLILILVVVVADIMRWEVHHRGGAIFIEYSGDSTFHECEFFGASGIGIQHSSGEVSDCKFLGGQR